MEMRPIDGSCRIQNTGVISAEHKETATARSTSRSRDMYPRCKLGLLLCVAQAISAIHLPQELGYATSPRFAIRVAVGQLKFRGGIVDSCSSIGRQQHTRNIANRPTIKRPGRRASANTIPTRVAQSSLCPPVDNRGNPTNELRGGERLPLLTGASGGSMLVLERGGQVVKFELSKKRPDRSIARDLRKENNNDPLSLRS